MNTKPSFAAYWMKPGIFPIRNLAVLGSALGLLALPVKAVTVDGTRDGSYGSALAVQTVQTGFGDSTVGDGTSAGGSELDAGYGTLQGGSLYLFFAGNFENNGNHLNVFIDDGRAGQNTLAVPTSATMQAMNGSVFSPGFNATLALDLNDFSGTAFVEEYGLVGSPSGGFVGSFGLSSGIGTGSPGGTIVYGLNNSNGAGVTGGNAAANSAAALAVTTGLEIQIPLSLLGNPSGPIKVLADINGGGDGFLSNQFLPGLAAGSGNVGTPGLNFGAVPGQYFVVPVPEPSVGALFVAGFLVLAAFRRRATV